MPSSLLKHYYRGCVTCKRLKVPEERLTEYYSINAWDLMESSFEDWEQTSSVCYIVFIVLTPVYLSRGILNVLKQYVFLKFPQNI